MLVKKMLGHSSVSTTAGYIAHASDEKLRESMQHMWSPAKQQLTQRGVKPITQVTQREQ